MEIRYCCTHWGSEHLAPREFFSQLTRDGYSGLEINLSPRTADSALFDQIEKWRAKGNPVFIAQLVIDGFDDNPKQLTDRMKKRLDFLAGFKPDFVNSHTGRDFYSFEDNCRIIEAIENHAAKLGLTVMHETHRGRFSFHLPTLLPYLKSFPNLKLTADLSHWCNVSESLLEGQADFLAQVIPHIEHLHARVGSSQSAQIANPFAPEWNAHLEVFLKWWTMIVDYQKEKGTTKFTVTPEAGPFPYMTQRPFTRELLANQWSVNLLMKHYLQQNLN